MKTINLLFLTIIFLFAGSCDSLKNKLVVGNYYGKTQNGLALILNDQAAMNLRLGWYENGNYQNWYDDFIEEQYYKGAHEPDQRYVYSYFLTDGRKVAIEWFREEDDMMGRFIVDQPVDFCLEALPSWPGFEVSYQIGEKSLTANKKAIGDFKLFFSQEPDFKYTANGDTLLVEQLRSKKEVMIFERLRR